MSWKFCVAFMLISFSSFAQKVKDDAFYLTSSETIKNLKLGSATQDQLEESLIEFHSAKTELLKADVLINLLNNTADDRIIQLYGELGIKRIDDKIRSKTFKPTFRNEYLDKKAQLLNALGTSYTHGEKARYGLDLLFQATKIAEEIKSLEQLSNAYVNIGGAFFSQNDLSEALRYHKLAEKTSLQLGDTTLACYILNNIGAIYNDLKDYPKAKLALKKGLALSKFSSDHLVRGMVLNNLGGVYSKTNDGVDTGIVLLKKALIIFDSLNSETWLAFTYAKMANIYLTEKDINSAHQMALSSYAIGERQNNLELIRRSSLVLRKTFQQKGDYKNAFFHSELFLKVTDELRGEQSRVEALKIQNKFELEKQKELDKKEREKQRAIANANKKEQRIINYSLIFGSTLLLIFTVIVVCRLRTSNVQKKKIALQNEEKKLLLKEIHHRVKNNFQIVSSLLRLQAADMESSELETAFDDAISRIQSMASVHELIYKKEMFAELSAEDYLNALIKSIQSYSIKQNVKIYGTTNLKRLNVKTSIPVGIIINELASNSMKYAFNDGIERPEIHINMVKSGNDGVLLSYKDNGHGYDRSLSAGGFGVELIETILEQVNGTIEHKADVGAGNELIIQFTQLEG